MFSQLQIAIVDLLLIDAIELNVLPQTPASILTYLGDHRTHSPVDRVHHPGRATGSNSVWIYSSVLYAGKILRCARSKQLLVLRMLLQGIPMIPQDSRLLRPHDFSYFNQGWWTRPGSDL